MQQRMGLWGPAASLALVCGCLSGSSLPCLRATDSSNDRFPSLIAAEALTSVDVPPPSAAFMDWVLLVQTTLQHDDRFGNIEIGADQASVVVFWNGDLSGRAQDLINRAPDNTSVEVRPTAFSPADLRRLSYSLVAEAGRVDGIKVWSSFPNTDGSRVTADVQVSGLDIEDAAALLQMAFGTDIPITVRESRGLIPISGGPDE